MDSYPQCCNQLSPLFFMSKVSSLARKNPFKLVSVSFSYVPNIPQRHNKILQYHPAPNLEHFSKELKRFSGKCTLETKGLGTRVSVASDCHCFQYLSEDSTRQTPLYNQSQHQQLQDDLISRASRHGARGRTHHHLCSIFAKNVSTQSNSIVEKQLDKSRFLRFALKKKNSRARSPKGVSFSPSSHSSSPQHA